MCIMRRFASRYCSMTNSARSSFVSAELLFKDLRAGFRCRPLWRADGNGKFTGLDMVSDRALITRGRQYSGTYSINSDSTGRQYFRLEVWLRTWIWY